MALGASSRARAADPFSSRLQLSSARQQAERFGAQLQAGRVPLVHAAVRSAEG